MNDAVAIRDIADGAVGLWLLDLSIAPSAAQCNWLSVRELDRALQFREERDRRRYLAAHCGLRVLLGDFAGIDAGRMAFSVGPWGKPSLSSHPDVQFSMSYASDRALVGLSSAAEIGVDIEMLRVIEDADELADAYFTEAERADLNGTASFLRGWTRKEACIKAVGLGLSLHPSTFTSGLSEGRVIAALPLPTGPAFVDVRTVTLGPDIIAACATVL